jgi:hypothetical protein
MLSICDNSWSKWSETQLDYWLMRATALYRTTSFVQVERRKCNGNEIILYCCCFYIYDARRSVHKKDRETEKEKKWVCLFLVSLDGMAVIRRCRFPCIYTYRNLSFFLLLLLLLRLLLFRPKLLLLLLLLLCDDDDDDDLSSSISH